MSTANCRPTAARPSPPGSPRIPSRPRWSRPGASQAESIRARYGAVADEPVPERLTLDRLMRQDRARSGRSWAAMAAAAAVVAFMVGGATRLGGARRFGGLADPAFDAIHRRRARRLQALRGRGAPPGRGAGQRAQAHDAVADEAARLSAAHSRPAIDRPQAGRRPAAAGTDRRGRAFYMYEGASGERFTIYSREGRRRRKPRCATRTATALGVLWVDDKVAYVVSGTGRPRAAREGQQDDLRAGGQERRKEVVRRACNYIISSWPGLSRPSRFIWRSFAYLSGITGFAPMARPGDDSRSISFLGS